jgi:ribosomal protein L40E
MGNNSWYEGIEKEINSLKEKMSKSDYSTYELDGLLRLSKRILSLSSECSQCAEFKEKITNAISGLTGYPDISKEQKDNYIRTFRTIVKHFEKYHSTQSPLLESVSRYGCIIGLLCWLGGIGLLVGAFGLAFMVSEVPDKTFVFIGFGISLLVVGTVFVAMWMMRKPKTGEPVSIDFKDCKKCGAVIPETAQSCPKCGVEFEGV